MRTLKTKEVVYMCFHTSVWFTTLGVLGEEELNLSPHTTRQAHPLPWHRTASSWGRGTFFSFKQRLWLFSHLVVELKLEPRSIWIQGQCFNDPLQCQPLLNVPRLCLSGPEALLNSQGSWPPCGLSCFFTVASLSVRMEQGAPDSAFLWNPQVLQERQQYPSHSSPAPSIPFPPNSVCRISTAL